MNTIVIGIGNPLRGDDGAGLEIVQSWQEKCPRSANQVKIEYFDEPGLSLLNHLNGMKTVILVDAFQSTEKTGTVMSFDANDLSGFINDDRLSHGWGVIETLRLGRTLNLLPATCWIRVLGIVGENFELGAGYSQGVKTSIEKAIVQLEMEVQNSLRII